MIVEKLHRRFGRTENGRIGWLPPIAEEGDFIRVFDGMVLPYATRPAVDGRYPLIGECIIPGLMMGEAVELSRVVSEIIVLKNNPNLLSICIPHCSITTFSFRRLCRRSSADCPGAV